MKIYATRLGMIPSTEIAYMLRVEADRRGREEALAGARRARAARRREFWTRVRAGLGGARRARAA
jgi:hypothetical protein